MKLTNWFSVSSVYSVLQTSAASVKLQQVKKNARRKTDIWNHPYCVVTRGGHIKYIHNIVSKLTDKFQTSSKSEQQTFRKGESVWIHYSVLHALITVVHTPTHCGTVRSIFHFNSLQYYVSYVTGKCTSVWEYKWRLHNWFVGSLFNSAYSLHIKKLLLKLTSPFISPVPVNIMVKCRWVRTSLTD